jgi:hypothetical protein
MDDLEFLLNGTSYQFHDFLDITGLQFWFNVADLELIGAALAWPTRETTCPSNNFLNDQIKSIRPSAILFEQ